MHADAAVAPVSGLYVPPLQGVAALEPAPHQWPRGQITDDSRVPPIVHAEPPAQVAGAAHTHPAGQVSQAEACAAPIIAKPRVPAGHGANAADATQKPSTEHAESGGAGAVAPGGHA